MNLDPKGIEAFLDAFNFGASVEQCFAVYLGKTGSVIAPSAMTEWKDIDTFPFDADWPSKELLVLNRCSGPEIISRVFDDSWRHEDEFKNNYSHWAVLFPAPQDAGKR